MIPIRRLPIAGLAQQVSLVALVLLLTSGCAYFKLREQQELTAAVCTLQGSVRTAYPSDHQLVVGLVRLGGEEPELVDHFVLEGAGRWIFEMTPGTYALGAFEDVNGDGIVDDEPTLSARAGPTYELAAGERKQGVELVIPREGRPTLQGPIDVAKLQARSVRDQLRVTLGQLTRLGEVTRLDDPRFSAANGDMGLWKRWDFMFDVGLGLYLLEPCDPAKTPILFVHGMKGYPREFETLVEGLFYEDSAHEVRRRLPRHVPYHLIYGYRSKEGSRGPSADGVVPLKSALRLEVWEEAERLYPLDYDHVEILHSPEASAFLGAILAEAMR
jgi:hypothetical protein